MNKYIPGFYVQADACISFINKHVYHFAPVEFAFSESHIGVLEDGQLKVFKSINCKDSNEHLTDVIAYVEKRLKKDHNRQELLNRIRNYRTYGFYMNTDSPRVACNADDSAVPDETKDNLCDFSSYSPLRIEQFNRQSITKRVQPDYPPEAVQAGIQGRVAVKALVNEKGLVEKACAIEGKQLLRRSAEKAALQWKLRPAYGPAFIRPRTEKNPKNFAEVYIVFEFKLDKTGSKGTSVARP